MARVLCLSVIRSDFSKLLKLALFLREKGTDVEFYFDQRSHDLQQSIQEVRALGFNSHGQFSQRNKRYRKTSSNSVSRESFSSIKLFVFLKRVLSEAINYFKISKSFRKTLSTRAIELVIVPVNSSGYNIPVYLDICRKEKIMTACVPFAIGDRDALEKAILYSTKSSPAYLLNAWFTGLFKSWTLQYEKQQYLVLPAETILVYRLLGVKMKYPLSFYGVQVDHLLLENEYMLEHAKKQQVAANHLAVTGGILDDELVAAHNRKTEEYRTLCLTWSWESRKKLMCIALPPLVKEDSKDERFFSFVELVGKFLPTSMDLKNWNVLVCLHPRINKEHTSKINWPDGVRWTDTPVETLIPLCDLFVATFSSTIRTAIALKIPVINYDLLNFNYTLFRDLSSVAYVRSGEEYENIVMDLSSFEQQVQSRSKELQVENPLSSTMDGHSGERILNEITNILGQ